MSTTFPLAAELEAEIRRVLNEIIDPCSAAAGAPIGLVDMGIVHELRLEGSTLRLRLLPTFPACRFVPIFEAEIRKRLVDKDLSISVEVVGPEVVWDESLMTTAGKARITARRKKARAELKSMTRAPLRSLPIAGSTPRTNP
jgi:metal-sulfur cluster biosynthetic enzyme